jgi:hypothetical protein
MAKMRYAHRAREMIPRMMFSVFIGLEFLAPHDIKHQGHDASNNQTDK